MPTISKLVCKVILESKEEISINIFPENSKSDFGISSDNKDNPGEAEYKLKESRSYEYWVSSTKYQLEAIPGIVKPFKGEN